MPNGLSGSDVVCKTLIDIGIEVAIGIPGTQTVPLYESIRRSSMRSILATTETAASFQACGYYATTGRTALLCVTPGPGFQLALAGISEAREDSLAMLVLTTTRRSRPSGPNDRRHLDAEKLATYAAKKFICIDKTDSIGTGLREAYVTANSDEPGPVIVEISEQLLRETVDYQPPKPVTRTAPILEMDTIEAVVRKIRASQRPVLLCGRGCARASLEITALASSLRIPVITTSSGRGVIPETHPFACCVEYCSNGMDIVNELLSQSDLVLAIGNKFSQNSSGDYAKEIAVEKLIHVNSDTTFECNRYAGALVVHADALDFLTTIAPKLTDSHSSRWTSQEVASLRERFLNNRTSYVSDSLAISPEGYKDFGDFFSALRRALPDNAIVVTDSGAHQIIARNHWTAMNPESFVFPAGFQSMGFGIPAAVGAKLGNPETPVVVITGDGGFHMVGMEILTSIREKLPISVIVFRDDSLGLIRHQQWRDCGWESSTSLLNPDFSRLAESFGIEYVNLSDHPEQLEHCLASTPKKSRIFELKTRPSKGSKQRQLMRRTKSVVRQNFGEKIFGLVKRAFARGGYPPR